MQRQKDMKQKRFNNYLKMVELYRGKKFKEDEKNYIVSIFNLAYLDGSIDRGYDFIKDYEK